MCNIVRDAWYALEDYAMEFGSILIDSSNKIMAAIDEKLDETFRRTSRGKYKLTVETNSCIPEYNYILDFFSTSILKCRVVFSEFPLYG